MSSQHAPSIGVSVVTFFTDIEVLSQTLRSLSRSLEQARQSGFIDRANIYLIDNGNDPKNSRGQQELLTACFNKDYFSTEIFFGHGNPGYGGGHNLAIGRAHVDYYLVLNPDVILASDAISKSIQFMQQHPNVALLSPAAVGKQGRKEYLCKNYPAIVDLLLRGFAPRWLKNIFAGRLFRYEMREVTEDSPVIGVPIVSGCYMFFSAAILKQVKGFDEAYFMYFEDFDLSLRISKVALLAYAPEVHITHTGGGASKKGWRHIRMFIASAYTFYRKHGWRIV